MSNYPDAKWLREYENKRSILSSANNLNEYFTKNEICGKKIFLLDVGTVNIPTGNILVCDPLVYLNRDEKPYFEKVSAGVFPLTISVVEIEEDHYRYAAVRVQFNNEDAVEFIEALKGNENLDDFGEGEYFGFNVDAGLATVVDIKTKDAFCSFREKWEKENPDKNIYDDFFDDEFKKSYQKNPKYQREGGDWINFEIPGSDLSIPMIQSGFGDGVYPVYFGYDKNNQICQVVIRFMDIELTFDEKEE